MNDSYEKELEKIKKELQEFEKNLFTRMLNIMMSGELKEWSQNSPIGDKIEIDITLLEASDDINVQLLIGLHKQTIKVLKELG